MHSVAKTARGDHVAHLTNLWLHCLDVALSTKPWVHRHHQHHVNKIENVLHGASRSVWVESNSRSGAHVADVLKRAMQVRACFSVNDEALATSFDVTLRHDIGCVDHEVRFKRLCCVRTNCSNHVGSEGEVGHELAVHHVELNDVDAGFIKCMDFFTKLGEISGQYGGSDLNGQRHAIHPSQWGRGSPEGIARSGIA